MMTSSNGNLFRVIGLLCGEFTGPGKFPTQRPVTWSFDVFCVLRLNKRLSKQWWGCWCETPSRPLWRHCNDAWLFHWVNDMTAADGYPAKRPVIQKALNNRPASHYNDVITSAIASQITSLTIFYSSVYSVADKKSKLRVTCLSHTKGH